ncbi:unnamed protein product, partial [Gongylonema pulchrum]|uniref:Copper transport protein n=1 Tax=Gongylonema pulchrum TaxID=637853 RepID=A0A183EW73_9BILA
MLSVVDKLGKVGFSCHRFSALRLHFARNHAVEQRNEPVHSTIVVHDSSEHVDSVSNEQSILFSPLLRFSGIRVLSQLFTCYRIVQSTLYFAQVLLAYTLMLIAMTFNVWLILGIVFGEAIGYFLFFSEPSFD